MEKQSFLTLHNAIVANGRELLTQNGLCWEKFDPSNDKTALLYHPIFQLFVPSKTEADLLLVENRSSGYWGFEESYSYFNDNFLKRKEREYTSLRETILLFCAAINEEL